MQRQNFELINPWCLVDFPSDIFLTQSSLGALIGDSLLKLNWKK